MAEEHPVTETTPNDHHDSDTVAILGQQFTIYGGIYTVVFIGLAILTGIEIAAGSIKASWTIPLLLVLALAKAALVVLYYMHLRTDSRIFSLVLLVPLGMARVGVL